MGIPCFVAGCGLPVTKWRPDAGVDASATDTQVAVYGGVARKP